MREFDKFVANFVSKFNEFGISIPHNSNCSRDAGALKSRRDETEIENYVRDVIHSTWDLTSVTRLGLERIERFTQLNELFDSQPYIKFQSVDSALKRSFHQMIHSESIEKSNSIQREWMWNGDHHLKSIRKFTPKTKLESDIPREVCH
jgi:hypothetical protein